MSTFKLQLSKLTLVDESISVAHSKCALFSLKKLEEFVLGWVSWVTSLIHAIQKKSCANSDHSVTQQRPIHLCSSRSLVKILARRWLYLMVRLGAITFIFISFYLFIFLFLFFFGFAIEIKL